MQVTAVHNIGKRNGYNGRKWTKHGKLPRVDYDDTPTEEEPPDFALGVRVLKRGCTGEDVRELQTALIKLGFSCGAAGADGEFGKGTEKAVTEFQTMAGLEADGKFGPASLAALKEALDRLDNAPPAPEPLYTITIHCVGQAEMEAMRERWPDCEVTEE